ncbi:PTS lactose/cellobiose transporter subunit IIA [[Eubacterium] hominis]|uniref:PTS lactose/cellobiose transporter subunit IIA n=1 Tax=[Eubacterium] hominis TaxID=2764325 RepID=UPI003A4E650C
MDEKVINVAMDIILHAGEARNLATKAMMAELDGDKEKAQELLLSAKEYVKKAHLAQTKVIQDEARGNKIEICLLFIHAQDTLMTIASEVSVMEQMMKMNRRLEEKINGICN